MFMIPGEVLCIPNMAMIFEVGMVASIIRKRKMEIIIIPFPHALSMRRSLKSQVLLYLLNKR